MRLVKECPVTGGYLVVLRVDPGSSLVEGAQLARYETRWMSRFEFIEAWKVKEMEALAFNEALHDARDRGLDIADWMIEESEKALEDIMVLLHNAILADRREIPKLEMEVVS